MQTHWSFWLGFNLFVLVMLGLDLGVFHRKSHQVKFKEALGWSAFWIALAFGFAGLIAFWQGRQPALEFVTGYVVEESLSVDNLFVFLVLFRYFKVEPEYQHKVLFWGIVGALVMRGLFILAGVQLIQRFHWIIYVFGVFLIFKGITMLRAEGSDIEPEKNFFLRLLRKFIPVTENYEGGKFFVRRDAKRFATPLFIVLLVVELTDVAFATDSIPAILAITKNAFIVYTSNVFAIMGLRSLFFALAGLMDVFHRLHYGLSALLIFIGAKMLLSEHYPIPIHIALATVAGILTASIAASLLFPKKRPIET
jgi:tellurite resistance protein TerC